MESCTIWAGSNIIWEESSYLTSLKTYKYFLFLFLKSRNEDQLEQVRCDIRYSILGVTGVRVDSFTPESIFEYIVKTRIRELLSAAMKCVDLVSTEVMAVIKTTAEEVRMGVVCKIIKIVVGVVYKRLNMYA